MFKEKYIKYKNKYLQLKGGFSFSDNNPNYFLSKLKDFYSDKGDLFNYKLNEELNYEPIASFEEINKE